MHYAIEIVPFGDFADPRLFTRLARTAEDSGWEGLFVWDHLPYVYGWAGMDPWVALSAAAALTQSLLLGVNVAPLPRYRPHVLAQTITTLDRLSEGRVILGFGSGGAPQEFSTFGEQDDARLRAEMLDEGLQILDRLLRGETLDHQGAHYTVKNVTLIPLPVRQPRPPFWIGGDSSPALRRAARWDGWVFPANEMDGKMAFSPAVIAAKVQTIFAHRRSASRPEEGGDNVDESFDVAISGCSAPGQDDLPAAYAEAGATWWLETLFGLRGSPDEMLQRVKAGPPRS